MRITFLGTGAATPTRARNVTSIALQPPERQGGAPLFLFDCGEGTQHQILRAPHVKLSQLGGIFFTHLHGDHLFGLPGLLASRTLSDKTPRPVTLHGPHALTDYLSGVAAATGKHWRSSHDDFVVVQPGLVYEDEFLRITCAPARHGIEAYAYAVTERDLPGTFDVEKARGLGIAPGPIYGRLKAGETVTLPDGRTIDGRELTGPAQPGRKVVFSGDTIYTPEVVELARDADLLIHEATYAPADLALAQRALHSTSDMAARVACEANVKVLFLTHVSPRYEGGGHGEGAATLDDLVEGARATFPNTFLAHDFLVYDVPRRSETA